MTLARPVRPPAETPVALSMYAVTVEVPRPAPTTVPTASAMSAPRARQRAVPHEPGLLGNPDERSNRIEQREKEEHEDDRDHLRLEGSENVQLKQGRRDRGWSAHDTLKLYQSKQPGGDGGGHHADKQRPTKPSHEQHCRHDEPKQGHQDWGRLQVAKGHQGARRVDDHTGPLKPDHGDEQADPNGDRVLQ